MLSFASVAHVAHYIDCGLVCTYIYIYICKEHDILHDVSDRFWSFSVLSR